MDDVNLHMTWSTSIGWLLICNPVAFLSYHPRAKFGEWQQSNNTW